MARTSSSPFSPLVKRMAIMLVVVGVILGGIFGFQAFKAYKIKQFMAKNHEPPVTVTATKAAYRPWQPQLSAVGSLRAVHGVDVTSEVAGIVRRVNFASGDSAKAGDILVQLDAAADRAQLRALRAAAALARTTYRRAREQLAVQAVSQATVDTAAADLKAKQAQAAQQAAVLAKKTIRAPFAGRLGISLVNVGQYLNPGAPIVTLQALDPVYVDFYLPQQQLGEIALGQKLDVVTESYPDRRFAGRVTAINSRIDAATRNIQIEGRIDNSQQLLLPGMSVEVDVLTGAPEARLTLPRTAVTFNPYGSTVFVVEQKGENTNGKPKLVAEQRFITTGETRADEIAVTKGVKAGEEVVTTGQLKLKNGSPVVISESENAGAATASAQR